MPHQKYKVGSFSKNFAWGDTGLKKLHTAIRHGFKRRLEPVTRLGFIQDCRLGKDIALLPVNFYLFNRKGMIPVDELVYQAICKQFSPSFNHLGLFALHLNRVGTGSGIVSRPAMWANRFVRRFLWADGAWQSGALNSANLDIFLRRNLDAQTSSRIKCRTNYRRIYELCGLIPTQHDKINSQSRDWITAGLFLAWDRHVLAGGSLEISNLVNLCKKDELYMLFGMPQQDLNKQCRQIATVYSQLGGPKRFEHQRYLEGSLTLHDNIQQLSIIDREVSIERNLVQRLEQNRNKRIVAGLKFLYDDTCMFCETRIQVGATQYYSEGAHIRPLGLPHNGPDKASNMIVLCMHHHLQFDRGIFSLRIDGDDCVLVSRIPDDPLNGKKLELKHQLDEGCVKWHYDWYRTIPF